MAKTPRAELSFTAAQAAAFRLARHHLVDRSAEAFALREANPPRSVARCGAAKPARAVAPQSAKASAERLVDVARGTGGIQAQVMSAAETALWTRRRETTRDEIRAALFDRREMVKTSAMRLTLHLIPAADLAMVIAALRPMSMASLQRWHTRVGAKPDQVQALVDSIMEGLSDGPRTQQALIARARKKAGKGLRAWLDNSWGALRPAVIEGLIVYRRQGWISPVVLRGGAIAGVWFPSTKGTRVTLGVELFGRLTPALREGVEREAEAMGRFLGVRCDARFSSG